jgi:DNA-binding response OmpR family regulator
MSQVRILVVDDDSAVNELIQVILREEGQRWEILTARNGEEAIRIVREKLPDLIILDMMMPIMNGLDVCRYVTSRSSIPVIMVSGECGVDTKVRCLDAGAVAYIPKPFRTSELIDHVKAVLRSRNLK